MLFISKVVGHIWEFGYYIWNKIQNDWMIVHSKYESSTEKWYVNCVVIMLQLSYACIGWSFIHTKQIILDAVH